MHWVNLIVDLLLGVVKHYFGVVRIALHQDWVYRPSCSTVY